MKYTFKIILPLLLLIPCLRANASSAPSPETFPWHAVTIDNTKMYNTALIRKVYYKVVDVIPDSTEVVAVKRVPLTKYVKVDYDGKKGYVSRNELLYNTPFSAEEVAAIKKADRKETIREILIALGIWLAFMAIMICCVIFGKGFIYDFGIAVLSILISLFVNFFIGILPLLMVCDGVGGMQWWLVVLGLAIMAVCVVAALIKVNDTSHTLSYVFYHQIIKIATPSIVAILFVLLANWMESWKVSGFWGGAGIWLLTTLGLLSAAAFVRIAANLIIFFPRTFHIIDLINAVAFAYLGVIMGITIFNACEDVCSPAAWLALIGLVTGAAAVSEDPYPLEIDGERARETSFGHYVTHKGDHYHEEKSGWGTDIKRD